MSGVASRGRGPLGVGSGSRAAGETSPGSKGGMSEGTDEGQRAAPRGKGQWGSRSWAWGASTWAADRLSESAAPPGTAAEPLHPGPPDPGASARVRPEREGLWLQAGSRPSLP